MNALAAAVILSEAGRSRSECIAQSKDPYLRHSFESAKA
jgi:hypothetical protein